MSLSSDQNSHSFSDGSLELFVKLIDTNSVNEVEDIILSFHALENNSDTKTNENVIVSWASSNLELISDVLLGNKELNLGPWQAPDKTTVTLDLIKFTVFSDDGMSTFRNVHVWFARTSLWNKNNWSLSSTGVVSKPLERVIDVVYSDSS
jgi:hypothetical protein